jgi:hypothetical protein
VSATFPTGVPADGNVKVAWVPTIADQDAPTATELNAAGALDITCGIVGGGFTTNAEQTTSEDIRLCSRQTFQDLGDISYSIEAIEYIITPQDVSPTGENKIYRTLAPGTTGYIVVRWGTDYADAFAASDVVDVYHVTLGPQVKQAPERNTKLRARQTPYVVAPGVSVDVEVA